MSGEKNMLSRTARKSFQFTSSSFPCCGNELKTRGSWFFARPLQMLSLYSFLFFFLLAAFSFYFNPLRNLKTPREVKPLRICGVSLSLFFARLCSSSSLCVRNGTPANHYNNNRNRTSLWRRRYRRLVVISGPGNKKQQWQCAGGGREQNAPQSTILFQIPSRFKKTMPLN